MAIESRVIVRGVEGVLRWSYHQAATLGPWTVIAEPDKTTLLATVVSADAYAVAQRPLTFVVPRPKGPPWRWPIVSVSIEGASLTAALSPQE